MPSHTALPVDSTAPAAQPGGWWAVCLCAGWCGTCRDYRALFDALAQAAGVGTIEVYRARERRSP